MAPTGTVTINGEATISSTLAAVTAVTLGRDAGLTASSATCAVAATVTLGEGSTLTAGAGTFAVAAGVVITIADKATLDISTSTTFAPSGASLSITSSGSGTLTSTTATDTVFRKILDAAGGSLNVEQLGEVTLGADNTVKPGTKLTIGQGGNIKADGQSSTSAQLIIEGNVVLEGSGTLSTVSSNTDNPDITLASGKTITAGNIVITAVGGIGGIDTNLASPALLAVDVLTPTAAGAILVLTNLKIEAGDVAGGKGILVKAGTYTTTSAATLTTADITARGPEVGRAVLNYATSFQFTTAGGIDFGSLSTLHAAAGNSDTFLPASLTAGDVVVNFKAGARVSAGTGAAWVKTGDIITADGKVNANNTFYVLTADKSLSNSNNAATWAAKVAF
jgi:hypothetical protein